MKRGGPLRRKTPLRTKQQRLTRAALKQRRPQVSADERNARKTVAERSGGRCELGPDHPATDMHHRRNRTQGGRWSPANLLHICRAHHSHITVSPQAAMEQGWTVPSHREPADVPVWLAGRGFVFLHNNGDITELDEDSEVA